MIDGSFEQTLVYVPVSKSMPRAGAECLICVEFDDDGYGPAIFYGKYDGSKWVGAMPWDSCGDGSSNECVALQTIAGKVVAWASFPKVPCL